MIAHNNSSIESRVVNTITDRIVDPYEAAKLIRRDTLIAVSGYTSSGYPKVVLRELVKLHEDDSFRIDILSGANVGPVDDLLSENEMIRRRIPMLESRNLSKQVNQGSVKYVEQQMNRMPWLIDADSFGHIDVAIVEALRITGQGIVPTSSVGMLPSLLKRAKNIIVEINNSQPLLLEELHDVYYPGVHVGRKPIPLTKLNQKIGSSSIPVDLDKIIAIVASNEPEIATYVEPNNVQLKKIAAHLIKFLRTEYEGVALPPIQTGFGNLTNEIALTLGKSDFTNLEFFCGGVSQAILELVPAGKIKSISTGSVQMTKRSIELLTTHEDLFKEKLVIRNGELTNSSELISRFAPVAINTGLEIDIYGNVNSSHITGSRVLNGIGGGANFAENAGLSIIAIPSIAKNGDISTIVPMTSHVDITEHNVDVIITENGIADLRGCDEKERAVKTITNCSHPTYRKLLSKYFQQASTHNPGHHPVDLREALSWHTRLIETGSMKPQKEEIRHGTSS